MIALSLVFGALVQFALGDMCPSLNCTSLADGICAQLVNDHSLLVSASPCPLGSYCSLTLLYRWLNDTQGTTTFACTPEADFDSGTFLPAFDPTSSCGVQEADKDLAQGFPPKVCSTDLDCQLQDGTYSSCLCGANGFSYCLPHMSSRVYSSYWASCEDGVGELPDPIFSLWMAQYSLYPILQSPVQCAEGLFNEFDYLQTIELAATSEAWRLTALGLGYILLLGF